MPMAANTPIPADTSDIGPDEETMGGSRLWAPPVLIEDYGLVDAWQSGCASHAILHMRPDEIHEADQDHRQYHQVEAMEPHLQARIFVPLFSQSHANIGKHEAPRP